MNIFHTDPCPIVSAKNLCNKHSSRMPLESMGMLMYAFPEGSTPVDNSYDHRHYKHPSSIWARQSKDNFEWLMIHAIMQCEEYTRRYKREHDSEKYIKWAIDQYKYLTFPKVGLLPFARCFSTFKQHLDMTEPDTVLAYRKFYILDKPFAKWPNSASIPEWWPDKSEKSVDKMFKDGNYTKR
jgi:Pyrimidine dimer DNA glycosylase